MIITAQHAAEVPWRDGAGKNKYGYCVPGMRVFFKHYGLNFRSFIRHGIDSETLLHTRDHYAARLVDYVKAHYG